MNKNYIKPAVEVTEIDAVNIVATSLTTSTNKAKSDLDVLSKEFDFEDDNEEEW